MPTAYVDMFMKLFSYFSISISPEFLLTNSCNTLKYNAGSYLIKQSGTKNNSFIVLFFFN